MPEIFTGAGRYSCWPTGDYSTRQLANTSLNRWALMPRLAATYFDPKSGWQVNGVAVYAVSYENDATNYDSGDILNLEGSIKPSRRSHSRKYHRSRRCR